MPRFDGATFSEERDGRRLNRQFRAVFDLMADGHWRGPNTISALLGIGTASVTARMRDARKPRFGGHTVERRYADSGVWLYRLIVNREPTLFEKGERP